MTDNGYLCTIAEKKDSSHHEGSEDFVIHRALENLVPCLKKRYDRVLFIPLIGKILFHMFFLFF